MITKETLADFLELASSMFSGHSHLPCDSLQCACCGDFGDVGDIED